MDVETPTKRFVLVWNEFCRGHRRQTRGLPPPMFTILQQFAETHAKDVELEAFQEHCIELCNGGHMGREQALQCVRKLAEAKR